MSLNKNNMNNKVVKNVVVSDYLRGLNSMTSRPPNPEDKNNSEGVCRHLACRPAHDIPQLVMKHGLQTVFRMAVVKDVMKGRVRVYWEKGVIVVSDGGKVIDTSRAFFWDNLMYDNKDKDKNKPVYNLMNAEAYIQMSRIDEMSLLKHARRTEF